MKQLLVAQRHRTQSEHDFRQRVDQLAAVGGNSLCSEHRARKGDARQVRQRCLTSGKRSCTFGPAHLDLCGAAEGDAAFPSGY